MKSNGNSSIGDNCTSCGSARRNLAPGRGCPRPPKRRYMARFLPRAPKRARVRGPENSLHPSRPYPFCAEDRLYLIQALRDPVGPATDSLYFEGLPASHAGSPHPDQPKECAVGSFLIEDN